MDQTLLRQCARMFMVGYPGPAPDDAFWSLVDEGVFGAVLFKRNIGPPEQTAATLRQIKQRAGRPFILALDQEGGRVARLRGEPFTPLPPMRAIGQLGSEELARQVGRLLAFELRAVGFDWDFAPVLDVDTNPDNPVIGDRAFHREAEQVARMGVALAQGLEEGGVASCGKHFPGHGDTAHDSHVDLPRLPHGMERLRQVELLPFRAYAQAGLSSLMTAHVLFEAIDPEVPATLSTKVLDGILRQELGFGGVVVSDDLEMSAIADHYGIAEATVRGAEAGVDLFLVCSDPHKQREAISALYRAVQGGLVPHERVLAANARLTALLERFALAPGDRLASLGSAEHRALAQGLPRGEGGFDPTERVA
jgi:beta-N-acetylhexosaminidase